MSAAIDGHCLDLLFHLGFAKMVLFWFYHSFFIQLEFFSKEKNFPHQLFGNSENKDKCLSLSLVTNIQNNKLVPSIFQKWAVFFFFF